VDVVAAGAGKQLLARKTMSDMMSESLLFQEGDEFVLKKRPLPHIPVAYAHQMVSKQEFPEEDVKFMAECTLLDPKWRKYPRNDIKNRQNRRRYLRINAHLVAISEKKPKNLVGSFIAIRL